MFMYLSPDLRLTNSLAGEHNNFKHVKTAPANKAANIILICKYSTNR